MRASGRKEKRERGRAGMCVEDPEHARFILTPLMGPCVAITKKKLRRWSGIEKAEGEDDGCGDVRLSFEPAVQRLM